MPDKPRFGPAGFPHWFKELKLPTSELPRLLSDEGLSALEYEAVRWGQKPQARQVKAEKLGLAAERSDVWLTLHGSYYINLTGKGEILAQSKKRLIASMQAAHWMNAHTVAFHLGYYSKKRSHKSDLLRCLEALKEVEETIRSMNIQAKLGPETAGKLAQVGSLEEILTICENIEQTQPVIDWAHLHARGRGNLRSLDDFLQVIESVEKRLGTTAANHLHCHFSHVEYTFRGERRHHSLSNREYGPRFELLGEALARLGFSPVIISESPMPDEDAKQMRDIYYRKLAAIKAQR